jgi:steroid delta-isomerase-like uncharacterized protein
MTRDQVLSLVLRWQEAHARRDLATYAALYADKAVLESPLAGSVNGREAVRKTTLGLLSAFPDIQFTYEPAIIDDGRAAMAASVEGTHFGTFLGIEPTGRPFKFSLVFLLEFKNGQIVRDRRIYDFTGFLVQLGVIRARPK